MNSVYITGSSLTCALGETKEEAISKIKQLDDSTYLQYLNKQFKEKVYYSLENKHTSKEEHFYKTLELIVLKAIEDANLTKEESKDLSIFIGSTSMSISIYEEQNLALLKSNSEDKIQEIGLAKVGSYVEKLIDSKYKATLLQTACTSSANAFSYAANLIKHQKINKALVIGLELFNEATYQGFESLMLLSQEAEYKPFDKDSDGLILGEASSAVILNSKKNTATDFQYLSSYSNFDNHSVTSSNPDGIITFQCMKEVIKKSNLHLKDITCIKAHATGSELSNLSEANAIDRLFEYYNEKTDVAVLKPFIGHTLGACGVNEIVLLCECIKNGFIPMTLGFKNRNEGISFEPLKNKKLIKEATLLFSYIGFGGSNTSIILSNEKQNVY